MTLNSCSTSEDNIPKNAIALFNGFAFNMLKGENIDVPDSIVVNKYSKRWEGQPMQVPLFKHIKHKMYELYLGLPFNTSIKQAWLMQSVLHKNSIHVIESDSSTYVYSVKKLDTSTTYELFIEKEGNLFYMLGISDNHENLDSLFSYNALNARIKKYN